MTTEAQKRALAQHRARRRDLRRVLADEGVSFYTKGDRAGLPRVSSPKRKADCCKSLELFAATYLPHVFELNMSPGQRVDFATMQTVCVEGGRYAFASPRGDGKTSRVEAAIIWAALYGHRRCIVIVGADLGAANEIAESIKLELRTNERLRADFPVPCWAAAMSDDTALKAKSWTWDKQRLGMVWDRHRITLPLLAGADGSGCVIVPRGITGRLRGMRLKVGSKAVRPDLYAIDDPSTDESAASPSQNDTREKLVLGALMGSGGPNKTTAAFMPCTVICHDDLASRFLDHKKHPDWQGRKRSLVTQWPDAQETLWKQYFTLRRDESHDAANEFYKDNREAMDAGAKLDWPDRLTKGVELSALQHAENLLCDLGRDVFAAEYQNEPFEEKPSIYNLTAELVSSRVHSGRGHLNLPDEARVLIAATDINLYGLHTVATAFSNDHTGWVSWYGRHDGGGRGIVEPNCPERQAKQQVFAALSRHAQEILSLRFIKSGQGVRPGLWIIDAGFFPDVVKRFIEGPARTIGVQTMAARGYAGDRYRPQNKTTIGAPREGCHLAEGTVTGRFLAWHADYWREVSQRGWLAEPNAPGSLSLFEGRHTDFAQQVTREKLIDKLKARDGSFVWRWHSAPGRHDYGDCVSMTYAGAAWSGIGTTGEAPAVRKRKRYVEKRKCKINPDRAYAY